MENKAKNRRINLIKTIDLLLKQLTERERSILLRRYGLKTAKKHTLEQIGKSYSITRERVRQIERSSLQKLKNIDSATREKSRFHETENFISEFIAHNGGVVEENHLLEHVNKLHQKVNQEMLGRILIFIMHHLMSHVEYLKPTERRHSSWKLKTIEDAVINGVVDTIIAILEKNEKPLTEKELILEFESSEFFKANKDTIIKICDLNKDGVLTFQEIIFSYLKIVKKIRRTIFDKWGLINWKEVLPKKINDKAYLILKKSGKPLHFSEIANQINKANFDTKIACAATVHNELILNDQYVLVGRGIYALKEWGYKEGTVVDVIYNILAQAGRPMEKDEIVEEVLKTRMVKKSTVYLSLLNKNKFEKVGLNLYTIKKEV